MLLDPQRFVAGETAEWSLSLADYPASEWTLALNAGSSAGAFTATATADGESFDLSISAATSSAIAAGSYRYQLVVSKGADATLERHLVESGTLVVEARLDGATTADSRSTWKIIHDDLLAAYQDYVSTGALRSSYSIGDSSRAFTSHEEILSAIDRARYEVAKEERLERMRFGQAAGGRILARF